MPGAMRYADLTRALSTHCKPSPVVFAEHFHFPKCNQKDGESVSDYVIVALGQLSATCDFRTVFGR